jgi:N-acetyl-anhydromuramyl-L-alanine amidase AmpD
MYQIIDRPIRYNHDGTPLQAKGVVIHSTATPEATDENEIAYFNSGHRGASTHYFVDFDSISRAIKETEVAWHAGPTANRQFIGIELCEFSDQKKFEEVWKRAVWLTADICKRYGFGVDKVFSHREISAMYKETNHTDPDGYFTAHGKTWAQFKADVAAMLHASVAPAAPQLDPIAAQKVIKSISELYGIATPDVGVAYNFATNALRRTINAPVTTDLGTPTREAAEQAVVVLGSLWKPGASSAVRDALHYAAEALRDAVGIPKQ